MPLRIETPKALGAIQNANRKFLIALGEAGNAQAKALCPVDKGQLRNSIQYTLSDGTTAGKNDGGGEKVQGNINAPSSSESMNWGSSVEYAQYVNNGTRHQNAQPFFDEAVAFVKSKSVFDSLVKIHRQEYESTLQKGGKIVIKTE